MVLYHVMWACVKFLPCLATFHQAGQGSSGAEHLWHGDSKARHQVLQTPVYPEGKSHSGSQSGLRGPALSPPTNSPAILGGSAFGFMNGDRTWLI